MQRLHQLLESERFPNCRSLARELEVSSKTVQRDIDYLRDQMGYPIEYDPLHYGFHYTQPVTAFPGGDITEDEVMALLIAQKAVEQHRGTAFEKPLRTACRKILERLGGKITMGVAAVEKAVSFRGAGAGAVDAVLFEAVSRAVLQSLEILFQYQKLGSAQVEVRRARPYHLGCVEKQWYCFAFDLDRAQLRTFALPRMRAVNVTRNHFDVPAEFSVERYLGQSFGVFSTPAGARPQRVRIRFDAWAARLIGERMWHESQTLRQLPNGEAELALELGSLEEIERWVLSWGEHAEVLAPKRLRERFAQIASGIAAHYKLGAAETTRG